MTSSPSRRSVLALLGMLAIGGCGDAEVTDQPPAALHDLAEPWQPIPFAVEDSLVISAERICREGQDLAPAGSQLFVVDARGGNRLTLLFVGARDNGQCFVRRDAGGRLTMDGGEGEGGSDPWPPLGLTEITFNGVGTTGGDGPGTSSSHLIGRAGAGIAVAEVVLPSGQTLQASLNRGWFAAWWPGGDPNLVVSVRGYDAAGGLHAGSTP